jgi:hypothetical protein
MAQRRIAGENLKEEAVVFATALVAGRRKADAVRESRCKLAVPNRLCVMADDRRDRKVLNRRTRCKCLLVLITTRSLLLLVVMD